MAQRRARGGNVEAADEGGAFRIGVENPPLLPKHVEIGDRGDRDDRLEQIGIDGVGLERGIAAIGPAEDRELGGIGDALLVEPAPGIEYIAHRDLPGMEAVAREEVAAIAGRAAILGLEYSEALMREILHEPVEAPFVALRRPAVRHHQRRQMLAVAPGRQRQISRYHRPVGGGIAHRLDASERHLGEIGPRLEYLRQFLGGPVEEIEMTRIGVAAGEHQYGLFVGAGADEADKRRLQSLGETACQRLIFGIEIDDLIAVGIVGQPDDATVAADGDDAVDIDLGIGIDELAMHLPVERDPVERIAAVSPVERVGDAARAVDRDRPQPALQPRGVAGHRAEVGPVGLAVAAIDIDVGRGRRGAQHATPQHHPDRSVAVGHVLAGDRVGTLDQSGPAGARVDRLDAKAVLVVMDHRTDAGLRNVIALHHHLAVAARQPVDHLPVVDAELDGIAIVGLEHALILAVGIRRDGARPVDALGVEQPLTIDAADDAIGSRPAAVTQIAVAAVGGKRGVGLAGGEVLDHRHRALALARRDEDELLAVGRQARRAARVGPRPEQHRGSLRGRGVRRRHTKQQRGHQSARDPSSHS